MGFISQHAMKTTSSQNFFEESLCEIVISSCLDQVFGLHLAMPFVGCMRTRRLVDTH